MSDEAALERYRQRYETWRHLDRLRYTTLQISVGLIAAIVAVMEGLEAEPPIWSWLALSVLLFFQWNILGKINDGIVANGTALREFASDVGDERIPDISDTKASVFYYLEWAFLILAGLFMVVWIVKFFGIWAP